LNPSARTAE